jgi:protein O-mannosyl-transferase
MLAPMSTRSDSRAPREGREPRGWRLLLGLAPVVLAMGVYQSALDAGFVFDDHLFWGSWCWQIEDASELVEVPWRPGCGYRRVRFVSLALDHLAWGADPFGYHLTNVLLHGLVTGLVVLLLRRLGLGLVAASLGALLWALHPLHTDAVTYVAGRRDLLSTAFFLAALLVWPWRGALSPGGVARAVAALVLYALAFESKEMAVTLPAVVALVLLFRPALEAARRGGVIPSPWRHVGQLGWLARLALGAGFALAGLGVLYRAVLHPMTQATDRLWGGDLFHHVLTIPVLYAKYAELVVAPFWLYGDYSDYPPASGLADPRVWVGLAVLAALWGGGLWASRRRPWLAFGLLWVAVTLLPVSQIVPHHELLAEHYLYLPLLGLAVAGGRGVELALGSPSRRRLVPVGLGALAVLWTVVIADRNRDFADEESFARALLAQVPESQRGHLMLAHGHQLAGRLDAAARAQRYVLERARPGTRFHHRASQYLLVTLASAGKLAAAESAAFAHLSGYPNDAKALQLLGTVRARQGYPNKALAYLSRAVEAAPTDVEARLHLGVALMSARRVDEAEPHLDYVAERWRGSAYARLQWALVPFERGERDEARRRLEQVLELDSGNAFALKRLFLLARERGDDAAACAWFARLQPLRADLQGVEGPCDGIAPR